MIDVCNLFCIHCPNIQCYKLNILGENYLEVELNYKLIDDVKKH